MVLFNTIYFPTVFYSGEINLFLLNKFVSMIKKYDLLMLNFILLLIFIIIAPVREIVSPSEDWHAYPILGNFMIFMLYIGIPLLGLVARFYFVNFSWVWPVIIFCEIILAWPCSAAILYWADLKNEIYTGLFLTAPCL